MGCVHNRCVMPTVDGQKRCPVHQQQHSEDAERRRLIFRKNGKCGVCGKDAVPGKARCKGHDTSMGINRCSYCRERGHTRSTCPVREQGQNPPKEVTCRVCKTSVEELKADNERLLRKVEILTEAVDHYADEDRWFTHPDDSPSKERGIYLDGDGPRVAQEAKAKLEQT